MVKKAFVKLGCTMREFEGSSVQVEGTANAKFDGASKRRKCEDTHLKRTCNSYSYIVVK